MDSVENIERIAKLAKQVGNKAAAEKLGLALSTVQRRVRDYRKMHEQSQPEPDSKIMRRIRERFTDAELQQLAAGGMHTPTESKVSYNFDGKKIKIGVISDTHLGSKFTNVDRLYSAFDKFKSEKINFAVHCGDVFEGVSSRAGHVYELTHVGYQAQLEHGQEVFDCKRWGNVPMYMIDGNHDRWYIQSAGAMIVKELCAANRNLYFLGHDEGDIQINKKIKIKLWHGEDGSSYAFSYRIQKIVESFSGGEKPSILFCGHAHKSFYVFIRNVHCISAAAIQSQSKWMRSKRHASHGGFWIVEAITNAEGIVAFTQTWYPFYE